MLRSVLRRVHVQMHLASGWEGGTVANEIRNSMSAALLAGAAWRKSKRSGAVGNCVEIASLDSGEVAVRNSRHPDGPTLIYTSVEMAAFVAGVKDGEFDDVIG